MFVEWMLFNVSLLVGIQFLWARALPMHFLQSGNACPIPGNQWAFNRCNHGVVYTCFKMYFLLSKLVGHFKLYNMIWMWIIMRLISKKYSALWSCTHTKKEHPPRPKPFIFLSNGYSYQWLVNVFRINFFYINRRRELWFLKKKSSVSLRFSQLLHR